MMDNIKSRLVTFFAKPGSKISHFLYTYGLASIVALTILEVRAPAPDPPIYILFAIVFGWIFLPAGLGWLFFVDSNNIFGSLFAGWLVYIAIIYFVTFTKNKKILYFFFIFFLILNIYGCATEEWNIS